MFLRSRISSPHACVAMAALAAIGTGCVSTPPPTAAGTPASVEELRALADFSKQAQDEGWMAQVRDGLVLYCKDETPLNSRFAERTCFNEASLQQRMLAEEMQRRSMQRSAGSACPQTGACMSGH